MADGDMYYEFISNGGCTRCDAMDGRLSADDPMPRPHSNCTCQIVKRDYGIGSENSCDESLMRYTLVDTSSVHHGAGDDPDDEFDIVHTFHVRCPDGENIEADIVVSTTYGSAAADIDAAFEDAFAEALELIEELAATECRSCPAPPLLV